MNKPVPDPPIDLLKNRAAFNRALEHYLPSQGFHTVNEDLSFEDSLLYTASLLQRLGHRSRLRRTAAKPRAGKVAGGVAFAGNCQDHRRPLD